MGAISFSYLSGSNGVFGFHLLPPGPALSLAAAVTISLASSSVWDGPRLGFYEWRAGLLCAGLVPVSLPSTHLFPVQPLPSMATAAAPQWARQQEGLGHLPAPACLGLLPSRGGLSQELISALRRLPGFLGSGRPRGLRKGSQEPRPRERFSLRCADS